MSVIRELFFTGTVAKVVIWGLFACFIWGVWAMRYNR